MSFILVVPLKQKGEFVLVDFTKFIKRLIKHLIPTFESSFQLLHH